MLLEAGLAMRCGVLEMGLIAGSVLGVSIEGRGNQDLVESQFKLRFRKTCPILKVTADSLGKPSSAVVSAGVKPSIMFPPERLTKLAVDPGVLK